MHTVTVCRWLVAAAASLLASVATAQSVRISELHYDNTGTDAGEAIEVSAPAGTDLTGWQVVLYNGTGGVSYNTQTLSGTVPAICDARGVVVINYPSNGIQNGSPDGIALVDPLGTVILSSNDAGESFQELFRASGRLPGFALSKDGEQLALGGPNDGVWLGPSGRYRRTSEKRDEKQGADIVGKSET